MPSHKACFVTNKSFDLSPASGPVGRGLSPKQDRVTSWIDK